MVIKFANTIDPWISRPAASTTPANMRALPLADELLKEGHLVAPGPLFSSNPAHNSKMRFNVGRTMNSPVLPDLERLIKAHRSTG